MDPPPITPYVENLTYSGCARAFLPTTLMELVRAVPDLLFLFTEVLYLEGHMLCVKIVHV